MKNKHFFSSTILWVLLGFLASYLLFFVIPVFLNPEHEMKFVSYIPTLDPIGIDLKQMTDTSKGWFIDHNGQYRGFPPLGQFLFVPFLMLSHSNAYIVMVGIILISYFFITFMFPLLLSKEKQISPVILLMFIPGLFSYGFQFELERGQFNVIAMTFCFLAIYIFHYHHKLRYLAYLLFSLSIQFKLYPAIFIFMFMRNPRDWKQNLRRFVMIGLLNVSLLFVLGIKAGFGFLSFIINRITNPYIWIGNGSAKGFFLFLAGKDPDKLAEYSSTLALLSRHPLILEKVCLLFFVSCFIIILFFIWKNRMSGLNVYLLITCIIGALIIPAESMDYKLSIVVGPLALFFNSVEIKFRECGLTLLQRLMIFVMSASYFTTLFSYTNRPLLLKNSFPMLMILLVAMMMFMWITEKRFTHKAIGNHTDSGINL